MCMTKLKIAIVETRCKHDIFSVCFLFVHMCIFVCVCVGGGGGGGYIPCLSILLMYVICSSRCTKK